jgi:hypothetical protein
MKPEPDPDPELMSRPKPGHWRRPLRSLSRLMTLIALSGLALAAYSERARPKPSRLGVRNVIFRQVRPGLLQQSPASSLHEPSVIVAPPGIDEAMIVTARRDIDEAMIVNPARTGTGAFAIPPSSVTGRAPLVPWQLEPQAPRRR